MLFVGVFCGSDLFTGVYACVLYCTVCVVLYIVFSYAVSSYLHIASF